MCRAASRSSDHDRHAALERALLRAVRDTAVDRDLMRVPVLPERTELTRHLDGELPRRHDDQRLRSFLVGVDPLDDRDRECRGLPGPRLRLREQVAAAAQHRDRLLLHRGRRHETQLVDRARDVGVDLQRAEAACCSTLARAR